MPKPTPQVLQLRKIAEGKDVAMRRWAICQLMSLDPEWLQTQRIAPPETPEGGKSPSSRPPVTSEGNSGVSEAIGLKTAVLLSVVTGAVSTLRDLDEGRHRDLAQDLEKAANDLIAAIEEAEGTQDILA